MSRLILSLVCSVVFALFSCQSALAVPASPDAIDVVQPDGTSITVKIKGDESRSWIETLNGYSIVKDPIDGSWRYATVSPQGELISSGVLVDPLESEQPTLPKHLIPTASIREAPGARTAPSSRWSFDSLAEGAPWDPLPVARSGEGRLLIIFVGFNDIDISTPISSWQQQVFSETPDAPSTANFFSDNSNGLFSLTPVEHSQPGSPAGLVKVKLNANHPDYSSFYSYSQDKQLIESAVGAASAFVDFAAFDENDDGVLVGEEVAVYLVVAGYEASGTNNVPSVWAHAWREADFTVAGKVFTRVALSGELNHYDRTHPMGVIAHELGHSLLQLPDLYDVSGTNGGVGYFSLMAGGSWGALFGYDSGSLPVTLDAWSRLYLGWARPAVLAPDGGTQLFGPALSENSIVRLGDMPFSPTDYFLVENRTFDKWDRGLDRYFTWSGGLLVLHLDSTVGTNDYSAGPHQGVMIVEADSSYCSPATTMCRGHYTNLFYNNNNTAFTSFTSPAARFYAGSPVPTTISNISLPSDSMTATLSRYNRGAPSASDSSGIVFQGEPFQGTISYFDPDGDSCDFVVVSEPSKGVVQIDPHTGGFVYTSDEFEEGTDTFTFDVTDGELTSAKATVTLEIVAANHPPELKVGPTQLVVNAGEMVNITILASDPDGDQLTWQVSGLPPGSSFDPISHLFSWQTKIVTSGVYATTFKVTDDGYPPEEKQETVTITVAKPTQLTGGNGGCFINKLLQ